MHRFKKEEARIKRKGLNFVSTGIHSSTSIFVDLFTFIEQNKLLTSFVNIPSLIIKDYIYIYFFILIWRMQNFLRQLEEEYTNSKFGSI